VEATRPILYSGQGFSPKGEKGRFVLPPQFRKSVRQSSGDRNLLFLSKHERWDCLIGFGDSRRFEMLADLDVQQQIARDRGDDFDYDTKASLIFGCLEVPYDDSGRFVVPAGLIVPGGVGDAMFFQGGGKFFSLWNPAHLEKMGAEWAAAKSMCASFAEDMGKGRGRKV
jgi:MraZ protein